MTQVSAADKSSKFIVRETGVLMFSTYLSQFVSVFRGIFVASFLGPSLYGVWSLIKTYLQVGSYSALGSGSALGKELPFNAGQGKESKNQDIKRTALSFSLLVAVLIALATFMASFLDAADGFRIETRLAAIVFILNAVHLYLPHQFRGEKKIYAMALYGIAYTVMSALFGLTLMVFYGIVGLLIGAIITNVILIVSDFYSVFVPQAWHQTTRALEHNIDRFSYDVYRNRA